MIDDITSTRLSVLYPALADKVRGVDEILSPRGIQFRVVQGLRTWDEQNALYAQGRTAPGPRVTNAPGGYSWHNFGLAVDVVPDDPTQPGFQPDWDESHPAWQVMVEAFEHEGFRWGKAWNDDDHFELTGQWGSRPPDEVRALYDQGGLQAVWNAIIL